MSNLFGVPLTLAFVAFMFGWLAAKFASYVGARAAGLEIPEHERTIRALEASLRVAKKDAAQAIEKLSTSTLKLDNLHMSTDELEQTIQFQEEELDTMRGAIKSESKKVAELRRTLSDRAEETIRANVIARDSETELSVLKAGTEALFDNTECIEAQREDLTNRLKALDEMLPDEAEAALTETVDSEHENTPEDQYLSDC
jgi:chromosome segregation ATPase